ncbi:MAG: hypothetical protein V1723_02045 [Candidatus Uhrbacteria bacterium]
MTARAVNDELDRVLGRLSRKWRGVQEKVEKGVLPSDKVFAALQAIGDGHFGQLVGDGGVVAPVVRQRPRLIHGLFTPPDVQLENVRSWKTHRGDEWADVPEEWFTNLGSAPAIPEDLLTCVVLELALPDKDGVLGSDRSLRAYVEMLAHQHPNFRKSFFFARTLITVKSGAYVPGLQWRVLDLGAYWYPSRRCCNMRPIDVRDDAHDPNVDLFAALVQHPKYVCRMDGRKIPFLWVSGFRVKNFENESLAEMTFLVSRSSTADGQMAVFLGIAPVTDRESGCSFPKRKEIGYGHP